MKETKYLRVLTEEEMVKLEQSSNIFLEKSFKRLAQEIAVPKTFGRTATKHPCLKPQMTNIQIQAVSSHMSLLPAAVKGFIGVILARNCFALMPFVEFSVTTNLYGKIDDGIMSRRTIFGLVRQDALLYK
jgi:hypothetical protein